MTTPGFILGCERSGSTWVANLLDAHPRTDVYLEPCAGFARIFPGLPDRFDLSSEIDPAEVDAFRAGFERLPAMKHPGLYRPGRAPALRSIDAAGCEALSRLARRCGRPVPLAVRRHRLLNLHASETPAHLLVRKVAHGPVPIVKELRLNLRVEWIQRAFPDARCLLLVRDPAAQVASVRRLFGTGHLGELRSALPRLGEAVKQSERLRRFRALAPVFERDPTSEEALLAWWLISYDVLISDCARLGMDHRLLSHERLVRDMPSETKALLDFFGLDVHESVERYARASSTAGSEETNPLSTLRDSVTDTARARAEAPARLRCMARMWIEEYAESEALLQLLGEALGRCP